MDPSSIHMSLSTARAVIPTILIYQVSEASLPSKYIDSEIGVVFPIWCTVVRQRTSHQISGISVTRIFFSVHNYSLKPKH